MKAKALPSASRTSFQEALGRYESVLSVAAASSNGADAFLETCTAAFDAARQVDRAAAKANRRVRAHKERLRRELARLDRPAAALAALDLSELAEASKQVSFRDVAEDVRSALSVITSVREEVAQGPQDQGEAEEAALAVRVDTAVQSAASAERAFRGAREEVRRMNRGWQQLARPEVLLTRIREGTNGLPYADVLSELCTASIQSAEDSLAAAREGVMAVGKRLGAIEDMEAAIEKARLEVRRAQRDSEDKASAPPITMLQVALFFLRKSGAGVRDFVQSQANDFLCVASLLCTLKQWHHDTPICRQTLCLVGSKFTNCDRRFGCHGLLRLTFEHSSLQERDLMMSSTTVSIPQRVELYSLTKSSFPIDAFELRKICLRTYVGWRERGWCPTKCRRIFMHGRCGQTYNILDVSKCSV